MNHDSYSADYIRDILQNVKTIALVGASSNEVRPSYFVMKYLIDKGYEVIPTPEAEALADYVLSLKKDYPVPGVTAALAAAGEAAKK